MKNDILLYRNTVYDGVWINRTLIYLNFPTALSTTLATKSKYQLFSIVWKVPYYHVFLRLVNIYSDLSLKCILEFRMSWASFESPQSAGICPYRYQKQVANSTKICIKGCKVNQNINKKGYILKTKLERLQTRQKSD
jgi:hypothetical protein